MGEGNDLATDEGGFGLTSRTLGGLPIVNHVLDGYYGRREPVFRRRVSHCSVVG